MLENDRVVHTPPYRCTSPFEPWNRDFVLISLARGYRGKVLPSFGMDALQHSAVVRSCVPFGLWLVRRRGDIPVHFLHSRLLPLHLLRTFALLHKMAWHLALARTCIPPHLVALHVLVCTREAKSWRSVCLCDTAGSRRCEKYFSQGRRGGQHGRAVVVSNAGCWLTHFASINDVVCRKLGVLGLPLNNSKTWGKEQNLKATAHGEGPKARQTIRDVGEQSPTAQTPTTRSGLRRAHTPSIDFLSHVDPHDDHMVRISPA